MKTKAEKERKTSESSQHIKSIKEKFLELLSTVEMLFSRAFELMMTTSVGEAEYNCLEAKPSRVHQPQLIYSTENLGETHSFRDSINFSHRKQPSP